MIYCFKCWVFPLICLTVYNLSGLDPKSVVGRTFSKITHSLKRDIFSKKILIKQSIPHEDEEDEGKKYDYETFGKTA